MRQNCFIYHELCAHWFFFFMVCFMRHCYISLFLWFLELGGEREVERTQKLVGTRLEETRRQETRRDIYQSRQGEDKKLVGRTVEKHYWGRRNSVILGETFISLGQELPRHLQGRSNAPGKGSHCWSRRGNTRMKDKDSSIIILQN